MRKADYAEGLSIRLADLSIRLRRLGYRPKPARRVFIPKANGGQRALGVPSFEDRIVQDQLSQILQGIWEPEFRDCSYGFRPGRNAHQALRRLAEVVTRERTQWIVEADIRGFFDNVTHEHLMRFLAHRINDPIFLRIIQRFLKAGVMEDGIVTTSEHGTPQGGLVSPVLANIISITCWTSGLKSASQNRVRVPPIWCGMLMILWYASSTKQMPGDSWKNSRKGWHISIWKWSPPKR